MKKLLTVFILALSLFLCSSCDYANSSNQSSLTNGDCATYGHVDANDDEICDVCNQSVLVVVDFYALNDIHGKFVDTSSNQGMGSLTTYLKTQTANDDYSVILSSGDMWQGGSESNLTYGKIFTDWMNAVGFSSMTLGNHEFDWGEDILRENAEMAEFPFLAINVYDTETNQIADYCSPSVMIERGDVQIGIIGAIGDCYSSISSEFTQNVYFKTGDELTDLVKAESQRLKDAGADIIVYSLHDGYGSSKSNMSSISNSELDYYGAELSRDGCVDIVFEAHTHKYYVMRDTYGVWHMQGGGDHYGICHAEIFHNTVTGENSIGNPQYVNSKTYASLDDDEIIERLTEKYANEIAKGKEVLGYNSSKRGSDDLRTTLAKLYYELGVKEWGDEYDVVLGGGYMSARSPYTLYAGNVTYDMVLSIFPFNNKFVLCKISGSDLLKKFINSQNKNYYVYYESGLENKIVSNNYYYIVVDRYSSLYAPNNLTEIELYHDQNYFPRDLLADYIKQGGYNK